MECWIGNGDPLRCNMLQRLGKAQALRVYIYIYLFIHTHTHVCMYCIYIYTYTNVYIYICIYICTYVRPYVRMYGCMYIIYIYVYIHVCMHIVGFGETKHIWEWGSASHQVHTVWTGYLGLQGIGHGISSKYWDVLRIFQILGQFDSQNWYGWILSTQKMILSDCVEWNQKLDLMFIGFCWAETAHMCILRVEYLFQIHFSWWFFS